MSLDLRAPMLVVQPPKPGRRLGAAFGEPASRAIVMAVRVLPLVVLVATYLWLRSVDAIALGANGAVPYAILAFAALAGCVPLAWLSSTPRERLGFDGERVLIWKHPRVQREIGRAQTGQIIRATISQGPPPVRGVQQFWLDADGRERWRCSERVWDPDDLLRVAGYARIPVTQAGEITLAELHERYPAMLPTILGLDPQTPVTRDVFGLIVRNELKGRTLTVRDKLRLAGVLAIPFGWVVGKALGVTH